MINIIGGKYKKTNLLVAKNDVRPTSALKREAIFSILESESLKKGQNLYQNKCFIDLFAGSGSLGLEAISRGGNFCFFFENNYLVLDILEKNCAKVCKNNNYKIISNDINKITFQEINLPISTIFIDPPYKTNPFNVILNRIKNISNLNTNSKIVIETHKNTKFIIPMAYELLKEKIFGKTKIIFLKIKKIK
jgi:16S rRNA (guanine966-N2)-methyltransferase